MSSLWTPGGERPVQAQPGPPAARLAGDVPESADAPPIDEGEVEARLGELRDQLAQAPVEGIVAQVAYQLFEVAALHLSLQPPQLPKAQLAIDAMAALVDNLTGRLGEHEGPLREGLSQIRMAFVQIQRNAATDGGATPSPPTDPGDPVPPEN